MWSSCTDNATLAPIREIVLPSKRAMTLPSMFNVAYSDDGHFVYVAYVTPAASFGVLDPQHGTVLGEIDTAGCVLVIPSGPNRVSSICESGRLLTVTLDAAGHESSRAMSEPFFDADKDPVFVQGIPMQQGFAFLSFLGEVHEVNLAGAAPAFAPPWSLVTAGRERSLAPRRHAGRSRSTTACTACTCPCTSAAKAATRSAAPRSGCSTPRSHRRLARWPVGTLGGTVLAVQVSQDAAPLLFAATDRLRPSRCSMRSPGG